MTHAEILRESKGVISDVAFFAQQAFAQDVYGNFVDPSASAACRWCMAGAVMRTMGVPWHKAEKCAPVLGYLARVSGREFGVNDVDSMVGAIAEVNDRAGKKDRRPDLAFKDAHKMFASAIELAESGA